MILKQNNLFSQSAIESTREFLKRRLEGLYFESIRDFERPESLMNKISGLKTYRQLKRPEQIKLKSD